MATRQQVLDSLRRLERVKQELGITPRMELIVCGGRPVKKSKFSLRSLNLDLVAKVYDYRPM